MAVTNFKDRIIDWVGDKSYTTVNDENLVKQAILDGCHDVYRRITKEMPIEAEMFLTETSVANDNGVNLTEILDVASVYRRNGAAGPRIECRFVSTSDGIQFSTDSSSLHYAKATDPIFYVTHHSVRIKPAPTSDDLGYVKHLPVWSLTSWDSSTSSISDFPKKYYEHIVLYAAIRVLYSEMAKLSEELPEDVALPALNFGATNGGTDFWLNTEEDSEMVQSATTIIQAQIAGSQLDLAEYDKSMQKPVMKYNWAKERLQYLNTQYEVLFGASQPPPPPPAQGGR